jgi:hypothetical protein
VTIPLRRYQIPSLVRQTSSAGIRDPFVSRIVTEPDLAASVALVDTGAELTVPLVCVFRNCGVGFAEGEGDDPGEGDPLSDVRGVIIAAFPPTIATAVEFAFSAALLSRRRLLVAE